VIWTLIKQNVFPVVSFWIPKTLALPVSSQLGAFSTGKKTEINTFQQIRSESRTHTQETKIQKRLKIEARKTTSKQRKHKSHPNHKSKKTKRNKQTKKNFGRF